MSSGHLEFSLPGMKASAIFQDGKINKGLLYIGDIRYEGTFDDNSLLHGADCSITIGDVMYRGEYNKGELIRGKTYVDDKLIEEGEYTFSMMYKIPVLVCGTRYNDDYICKGVFDENRNLINGIKYNDKTTYEGQFQNGILIEGCASYKLNNQGKELRFDVLYKTVYDAETRHHLIKQCDVKYNDYTLTTLPRKLLVLSCCNGTTDVEVHKFYVKHLYGFTSQTIRFLHKGMFGKLSPSDEASLSFIIENLKKFTDYVGSNVAEHIAITVKTLVMNSKDGRSKIPIKRFISDF